MTTGSGVLLLVVMAAIVAFLVVEAVPAVLANTGNLFTETGWAPDAATPRFGVVALAWGTVASSLVALVLAVPVAVGVALFVTVYAPRGVASVLGYLVDLLAAVPSVVYGLWGAYWLVPRMLPVHQWLNEKLGWVPLFSGTVSGARTVLTASVVLAIMVLPIVAAVCREVFAQAPQAHREAALALGATRWEMIRLAVLPYGRRGVIGASMLGLGRALGETIAVAMVLSVAFTVSPSILEPTGVTFASNIALKFNESGPLGVSALVASGLVLFVITLVVNAVARQVAGGQGRERSGPPGRSRHGRRARGAEVAA